MNNPAASSRIDEVKQSMEDLQSAITKLCDAGMAEEANVLLEALNELRQSLSRLRVCDDGNIVMIH